MRLYVNTKEVPFLKSALREGIARTSIPVVRENLTELLERVALCEALQKSERRAMKEEQEQEDQ